MNRDHWWADLTIDVTAAENGFIVEHRNDCMRSATRFIARAAAEVAAILVQLATTKLPAVPKKAP